MISNYNVKGGYISADIFKYSNMKLKNCSNQKYCAWIRTAKSNKVWVRVRKVEIFKFDIFFMACLNPDIFWDLVALNKTSHQHSKLRNFISSSDRTLILFFLFVCLQNCRPIIANKPRNVVSQKLICLEVFFPGSPCLMWTLTYERWLFTLLLHTGYYWKEEWKSSLQKVVTQSLFQNCFALVAIQKWRHQF